MLSVDETVDECDVLDMLYYARDIGHTASHIDASKAPQWVVDALVRLESQGKVVSRPVTVHYGTDSDGVEATTNYIGFFLK